MADGSGDWATQLASGIGALALAAAAWIWGQVRGRRARPPADIETAQIFFDGPLEHALRSVRACEKSLEQIELGLAAFVREQRQTNDRLEDQARDNARALAQAVDDQIAVLKSIRDALGRRPDGRHRGPRRGP